MIFKHRLFFFHQAVMHVVSMVAILKLEFEKTQRRYQILVSLQVIIN